MKHVDKTTVVQHRLSEDVVSHGHRGDEVHSDVHDVVRGEDYDDDYVNYLIENDWDSSNCSFDFVNDIIRRICLS